MLTSVPRPLVVGGRFPHLEGCSSRRRPPHRMISSGLTPAEFRDGCWTLRPRPSSRGEWYPPTSGYQTRSLRKFASGGTSFMDTFRPYSAAVDPSVLVGWKGAPHHLPPTTLSSPPTDSILGLSTPRWRTRRGRDRSDRQNVCRGLLLGSISLAPSPVRLSDAGWT